MEINLLKDIMFYGIIFLIIYSYFKKRFGVKGLIIMKRYLLNEKLNDLPKIKTDVLIVGTGIAGLYAAFNLDSSMKVTIVTKASIEKSNSWLAQGGIASVIAPDDVFESHIEDTLKAGAGLCDLEAVTTLVEEGPSDIRILRELDVPFDKGENGEILITREGGHSCRRIVHCGGDATGRETTRRLGEITLARKNVDCLFGAYLVDILTDEDGVCGAVICDNGEYKTVISSNVVLATGGSGFLYTTTTNPDGAVGDGIAAAQRAGAQIFGMELVQFHPTTLAAEGGTSNRAFLISEAVRGEGGILRNSKGEAFMQGKHPLADLAPRDIVTREIIKEMNRTGEDKMFLDVSSMSPEFFEKRFPTISGECRARGVDVPTAWIPIRPGQHYLMGGIKTDLDARTSVNGLYACGECASTGVHGANRLASNSMLECLVFGRRASEYIKKNFRAPKEELALCDCSAEKTQLSEPEMREKIAFLRRTVTKYAGPVRTPLGMAEGKRIVDGLVKEADELKLTTETDFCYYNMLSCAKMILEGAIARKESIGAHYIVED